MKGWDEITQWGVLGAVLCFPLETPSDLFCFLLISLHTRVWILR